jgi:hypothetical protein
MKQASLTLPELALIATTRAALGAGVALLLSDRMTRIIAAGWGGHWFRSVSFQRCRSLPTFCPSSTTPSSCRSAVNRLTG